MNKRFMRRPEVEQQTGFSTSTLYRKVKKGEFPAPIRISENCVAWLESDVQEWIEARISENTAA